jgi:hypothetical protein
MKNLLFTTPKIMYNVVYSMARSSNITRLPAKPLYLNRRQHMEEFRKPRLLIKKWGFLFQLQPKEMNS